MLLVKHYLVDAMGQRRDNILVYHLRELCASSLGNEERHLDQEGHQGCFAPFVDECSPVGTDSP